MPRYVESCTWAAALLLLFFMNASGEAVSLCFFKFLGIAHCPGCGLGHAIHAALHGQFRQSLHHHLLGVPATAGLVYNAIKPFASFIKQQKIK